MRKFKAILLFSIFLLSCQKTTTTPVTPIVISGVTDFGNVIIGDQINSVIELDNSDSSVNSLVLFNLNVPFYLLSYQPSTCSVTNVPASTICSYKIQFSPSTVGQFSANVTFRQTSATIFGVGTKPGQISVSPVNFSVGVVSAGSITNFSVQFTNSGDGDVLYPLYQNSPELSVTSTTCPTIIHSGAVCTVNIQFLPEITNSSYVGYVEVLGSTSPTQLTFTSVVQPGPSSGNITFTLNPNVPSLTVSSPVVSPVPVTVTTNPITDQFGNVIADGTSVNVSVFNLILLQDPVNHTSTQLFTKNGVVSFTIEAGSQVGLANFSAQTVTSFGSGSINITN